MTIRVVCLVLAIFFFTGWLRLVGVAAAVVLPWIAVVMANAGPVGDGEQPTFVSTDRIGDRWPAGHSDRPPHGRQAVTADLYPVPVLPQATAARRLG